MFNQVNIIGNLGQDPELRYLPNGTPVCDLNVATNERWTDREGVSQERTTWVKVVVWRKQAEVVSQYLTKGRQVMVTGKLEDAEAWTDRDGNPRATNKITAQRVVFLGGNGDNGNGNYDGSGTAIADVPVPQPQPTNGDQPPAAPVVDELSDDEIPW